ncbi:MAG: hypothetical protein WCP06_03485 [Verrucomicrobiota bacterium]
MPEGQTPLRENHRASALLLVLWAMFFMSLTVLGVIEFANFGLDENVLAQKSFRALQLAESGIAIGLHPKVQPGDPVLHTELPNDESIEVQIEPEDGRLAINDLLQNDHVEGLRDLFVNWGMENQSASVLADSLADWVDSNATTRLNGAENDYYTSQGYPDYPRNRPFQTLEEMLCVRGIDKLIQVKPDWRDAFTIYGSGRLNMNGASAEAIVLITDSAVSQQQAETLVQLRDGADGEPNTEDDVRFRSLEEVRSALGMSSDEFKTISNRLSVTPTVLRVRSEGHLGNYMRAITVVAAVVNGKPPVRLESMEE